jgi:hypothetical protein
LAGVLRQKGGRGAAAAAAAGPAPADGVLADDGAAVEVAAELAATGAGIDEEADRMRYIRAFAVNLHEEMVS